jgi:aspartate racemase
VPEHVAARMRRQRTIGIIGGLSWEASALYYRLINEAARRALGGHHNARSVMVTVNFADVLAHGAAARWDKVAEVLADAARRLRRAGADFVLMAANTAHAVADEVASAIDVPLLHIADTTAAALTARGLRRVALVGTRFTTVPDGFYAQRLASRHGIAVTVPEDGDREALHATIVDELTRGVVRAESRKRCMAIIERLAGAGAEGVIVGCTELPLLLADAKASLPLFDTARIHAEAAVAMALAA